jgi:hypothetical protein
MSGCLFQYPPRAAVGRLLPKARVLAHARSKRGLKDRLSTEVEEIIWAFKLARDTVNLAASADVVEVQVFTVRLKPGVATASETLLRALDQAIPSPIVFELEADRGLCTVAAYKRPGEADPARIVLGDYLYGGWLRSDARRQPLPVALDMTGLYRELLRALIPLPARRGEGLRAHLERLARVRQAERECERLAVRLAAEEQFNRKVEINRALREAQQHLGSLRGEEPASFGRQVAQRTQPE